MKLNIDHSEFGFNRMTMDIEDLTELLITFLENQFPNWDMDTAFNLANVSYFDDHVEIEITLI